MLNDLQNIARSIDTLLLNDPYPETVKPDYLRRAVRDYPVRGGKRLRPALVIWCCELLGGSREQVLLSIRLINQFLISQWIKNMLWL